MQGRCLRGGRNQRDRWTSSSLAAGNTSSVWLRRITSAEPQLAKSASSVLLPKQECRGRFRALPLFLCSFVPLFLSRACRGLLVLNKPGSLEFCCLRRSLSQAGLSPQSKPFNHPPRSLRSIDSRKLKAKLSGSGRLRRPERPSPNVVVGVRSIDTPGPRRCDRWIHWCLES